MPGFYGTRDAQAAGWDNTTIGRGIRSIVVASEEHSVIFWEGFYKMNFARGLKFSAVAVTLVAAVVCLSTTSKSLTANAGPAAQNGAALFGSKCAICHGKDGKGMPNWRAKGQPDFTDQAWQKSVNDQQISDSIHNGKGKFMPAFKGRLTDDQISSLVAQVRTFGKK